MNGTTTSTLSGERDAADHAEQRADQADQRALDHEDLHDAARARAQRAQDRDVRLLVLDRHEQARHHLNAATAMMRKRMRNIMRFSMSTARKKFALLRVQSVM